MSQKMLLKLGRHQKVVAFILLASTVAGCTWETRNQISRTLQNWTGTNGVMDVIQEGKVMYRFVDVEKMTTAVSTEGAPTPRPYRFGYGVLDLNQNYIADPGEKKTYFEVSDYSTAYVFYENPTK